MSNKEPKEDEVNLLVEWSDTIPFAFTLRKTNLKKGQPTQNDYHLHLNKMISSTNSILDRFVFEQTGGLHMHGILQVPKDRNMIKFRVRGWKMHMVEIYSRDGWIQYMQKERLLELHEDEFIEDVPPIKRLRRSLFKDRNTAPAVASEDASASLPDPIS